MTPNQYVTKLTVFIEHWSDEARPVHSILFNDCVIWRDSLSDVTFYWGSYALYLLETYSMSTHWWQCKWNMEMPVGRVWWYGKILCCSSWLMVPQWNTFVAIKYWMMMTLFWGSDDAHYCVCLYEACYWNACWKIFPVAVGDIYEAEQYSID